MAPEDEMTKSDPAPTRADLIDAICGWGWDQRSTADAARAELLLAREVTGSDFLLSCLTGDVDAVRAALAREPELARRELEPRGWSALLYVSYAVTLRQAGPRTDRVLEIAKLLLEHGADPNAHYRSAPPDTTAFPALYAAIAIASNVELVRLLLEAGANPSDGQSLYHATERRGTDALELLHRHGVSERELSYVLLHALDFQDADTIVWFLEHGADPNARHPQSGEAALHWAIKRASPARVIELLLTKGADANLRTFAGHTLYPKILAWTPLDLARRVGRMDIVELASARGARAERVSEVDEFVCACACGDASAARARLAADPGLPSRLSPEDRGLMPHVAQQNQRAGVELMLELGFDPNARGWMEATALHWAACRGNPGLIRSLLAGGAELRDVGGYAGDPVNTALNWRWNPDGDYAGALEALVAGGARRPSDVRPTGDAALDAAVQRLLHG